jgi:hypothetical protein
VLLALLDLRMSVARADDGTMRLRLAQINSDADPQPGARASTAAGEREGSTAGSHIVVTFPAAAPESIIDEIAARYRLQLVARRVSLLLERRIVLYRVPDDRKMDELLAELQADPRVGSAEPNRQYLALPRRPPLPPLPQRAEPTQPSTSVEAVETRRSARAEPQRKAAQHTGRGRRQAVARLAPEAVRAPGREPPATASPRAASLAGNLRWPTADEPFVGPTTR